MFADVEISTYTLDALIGRRVNTLATENEDGTIVVARDVITGEGFVLNVEAKLHDHLTCEMETIAIKSVH
jgi:hypothetical protein